MKITVSFHNSVVLLLQKMSVGMLYLDFFLICHVDYVWNVKFVYVKFRYIAHLKTATVDQSSLQTD